MKHGDANSQSTHNGCPVMTTSPILHKTNPTSDLDPLDVITPQFFIPGLENRPYDPIVEALENIRVKPIGTLNTSKIKQRSLSGNSFTSVVKERRVGLETEEECGDVWTLPEVIAPSKNLMQTWDDFQYSSHSKPRPSPFLSEQPSNVLDAVRYHVNYKLKDPMVQLQYVLPEELWANLQLNLLGNSSRLFIWDPLRERFMPKYLTNDVELRITLEGIGHDTVSSALNVFLNIGTNIRRIDSYISRLRQKTYPIVHAFLYSLNSIISHIQSILSLPPPFPMKQLVGISVWYRRYDQILAAIASLCQCNGEPPFLDPVSKPDKLLDHIFKELEKLSLLKAPREVVATLAYILTTTSNDYFRQISSSIGLLDASSATFSIGSLKTLVAAADSLQLGNDPDPNTDQFDNTKMPMFFPKALTASLPAARKSLSILKSAGVLCFASLNIPLTWVWTTEELEQRWLHSQKEQHELTHDLLVRPTSSLPPLTNKPVSDDPLSQFAVFDLDPGSHFALNELKLDIASTFSDFLASFPDDLPIIAPTLLHLAEIVLRPLSIRATVLSNLSLRLFLDSLHLNFHLRILRSHFFLASSSFKRHLTNALLHSEPSEPMSGPSRAPLGVAIGLAPGLSSDKTWPPKGSDLSYSLRNVIVNSLEDDFSANEALRDIVSNAEQNLGFGLQDLPLEGGKARWLDPISIEALDFLYLDYKVSQPLNVVITPQTITKYQRVFTFLLQLMRAEIVMRITYRNLHSSDHTLLPYASRARSTARDLHFQLQTFLNSLRGYIYDSVISGLFDKYLAQIEHVREELHKERDTNLYGMNIFVLAESHSRLLDRVLRCSLLRGSHKPAGSVVRGLLDLVLRWGTLLANLRQGDLKDFEAEEKLLQLNNEFKSGMLNLIIAIRRLQEVQDKPKSENDALFLRVNGNLLGEPNGRDHSYLDEFLTRIDPSYWWRRQVERRADST